MSQGLALKINDPRTGVNRANASYRARALPKRPYVGKFGGAEEKDVDEDAKGEGMRAVTPGIINATLKAKEDGKTALHELQGEKHVEDDIGKQATEYTTQPANANDKYTH